MSDLNALLFDLDGTLVDSAPDIAAAVDKALIAVGREPVGVDFARAWVGNGARNLISHALGEPADDTQIDETLQHFLVAYREAVCVHSQIYPGVIAALDHLRELGLKLAVVTNKPEDLSLGLLSAVGLKDYFPVVIGGDTLAERKPHPLPMLTACERLGVSVAETAMVGDSRTDIDAAKNAGMRVFAVPYGYNRGEAVTAMADVALESMEELLRYVSKAA